MRWDRVVADRGFVPLAFAAGFFAALDRDFGAVARVVFAAGFDPDFDPDFGDDFGDDEGPERERAVAREGAPVEEAMPAGYRLCLMCHACHTRHACRG